MIDFIDVSKSLGGKCILNHVSFRINRNERVGFVGPNGAGKTTVFGMMTSEISPDKGDIMIPEKIRIGILHQQLNATTIEEEDLLSYVASSNGKLPAIHARIMELEQILTIHSDDENALKELGILQTEYESIGGYEAEHHAKIALVGLGFNESQLHQPLSSFSGGWQMRAAMARVLLAEPDVLLLDEPSNYLDIPAVEWLQKKLNSFVGTLLLISHDRFLLNTLTEYTLEINGGKITRYAGNYAKYIKERESRIALAASIRANQEKKREKLKENIERFRYKATKAAQVQMWLKMLEKMDEEDVLIPPEQLLFNGRIRIPKPPRCGPQVCSVEQLTHSYDGKRMIFQDVSFSIENGERLGVIGYNGMGKTTLLRILAGTLKPSSGTVNIGHNVVIGYQAQEFAELLPTEQSAFDVVRSNAPMNTPPSVIRDILSTFGFPGDAADKQCKVLSGGEKIKLSFARIFVNPPNFLILDEPTSHLDVAAREALQKALTEYTGTVCIVSHDMEFMRGTATTILEMRSDRVRKYYGNYDYYKEKLEEEQIKTSVMEKRLENTKSDSISPSSNAKLDELGQKERRRAKAAKRNALLPEKKKLEQTLAKLEHQIEATECEKAEVNAQLMNPTPQTDYASLNKRIKDLDYSISLLTLEWDDVSTRYEEFMHKYEEETT